MSEVGSEAMLAGPTAMEIAEFARYLGMDPAMDSNLLWIAEEALCSPLPENWEEAVRKDGTPYYFNKKENKSTNKHPLEDFYRSLYTEMKEIQANQKAAEEAPVATAGGGGGGPSPSAEALALASEQAEPVVRRFVTPNEVRDMATYLGIDTITEFNLLHIAHAAVLAPLPSNWLEFEDDDGNPYYYDRNTLRVTYRHPADEKYFKQVADERARMSSSGMSSLERRLMLMKDSKRKKAAPNKPRYLLQTAQILTGMSESGDVKPKRQRFLVTNSIKYLKSYLRLAPSREAAQSIAARHMPANALKNATRYDEAALYYRRVLTDAEGRPEMAAGVELAQSALKSVQEKQRASRKHSSVEAMAQETGSGSNLPTGGSEL